MRGQRQVGSDRGPAAEVPEQCGRVEGGQQAVAVGVGRAEVLAVPHQVRQSIAIGRIDVAVAVQVADQGNIDLESAALAPAPVTCSS